MARHEFYRKRGTKKRKSKSLTNFLTHLAKRTRKRIYKELSKQPQLKDEIKEQRSMSASQDWGEITQKTLEGRNRRELENKKRRKGRHLVTLLVRLRQGGERLPMRDFSWV